MLCATAAVRISAVLLLLSLGFLFQKWRCGKMMGKSGKPQCWRSSALLKKSAAKKKRKKGMLWWLGVFVLARLGGLIFCHARSFPNQATKPMPRYNTRHQARLRAAGEGVEKEHRREKESTVKTTQTAGPAKRARRRVSPRGAQHGPSTEAKPPRCTVGTVDTRGNRRRRHRTQQERYRNGDGDDGELQSKRHKDSEQQHAAASTTTTPSKQLQKPQEERDSPRGRGIREVRTIIKTTEKDVANKKEAFERAHAVLQQVESRISSTEAQLPPIRQQLASLRASEASLQASVQGSEASVQGSEANLQASEASVRASEANLQASEANLQADVRRIDAMRFDLAQQENALAAAQQRGDNFAEGQAQRLVTFYQREIPNQEQRLEENRQRLEENRQELLSLGATEAELQAELQSHKAAKQRAEKELRRHQSAFDKAKTELGESCVHSNSLPFSLFDTCETSHPRHPLLDPLRLLTDNHRDDLRRRECEKLSLRHPVWCTLCV